MRSATAREVFWSSAADWSSAEEIEEGEFTEDLHQDEIG